MGLTPSPTAGGEGGGEGCPLVWPPPTWRGGSGRPSPNLSHCDGRGTLEPCDPVVTPCSICLTSAAEPGRLLASFSSRRRINASSPEGRSGACQLGATGGVFRCWVMIATLSSPINGGRPVTSSYSIAPSEYRSDLGVTSPPIACS